VLFISPIQSSIVSYIIVAHFLIIAGLSFIPKIKISYKKSWWFGIIVTTFLFLSAYQLTIIKTEKFATTHFSNYANSTQYVHAKIAEPYLEKEKSLKVVVDILAVKCGDTWQHTCGKAMIYFQKESRALQLNYGDELVLKVNFKDVPEPQNPSEFNYKRFLAFHNVYQQSYVEAKNWVTTGKNTGNFLISSAVQLRNRLLTIFIQNKLTGDELGVGAALLLGFVDKLDADIISAYSSTGALHVLSVSGLHVAIVYFIFNWLLFFFDKIKHGTIIKAFLLILFLWFYAALTGLSPSVLRAATMFSFIIIAKAYNRNTNIYNTLAVSAFLLLCINPYLIMEVGFQLSYLAVIGIVYIQPKIYNWFEVNNWLLDQIWVITSVSIAAQIATFPLGLHYFHQFPNYFLFSNLIVIPISTAIVYLGIVLFVFAKATLIAGYLAQAFGWCVWFLNQSVLLIEKWPYSLLQGISISVFETWVLYAVIILFLYYFTNRKYSYLVAALALCVIIFCSQIREQFYQYQQKKFIVYNVPKTSAIDFIHSKSNTLLTDSAFAKNESGLLFRVKHNWWDLGLNNNRITSTNIKTNHLSINNNFIQFFDKRIVLIDKKPKKKAGSVTLPIDYLIISKNPKTNIVELLKKFHPTIIIFDSSNSEYRVKRWKEECCVLNQRFHSVQEKGAFIVNL
jgi:competence protein ComEC